MPLAKNRTVKETRVLAHIKAGSVSAVTIQLLQLATLVLSYVKKIQEFETVTHESILYWFK